MSHLRRLLLLALVGLGTAAVGAVAWAYFTSSGSGSSTAAVTSLSAPSGVTVPTSVLGTTVHVSWTGVAAPDGSSTVAYWVRRYVGATPTDACGSSHASPIAVGTGAKSCDDTSVASGTYTYTVTSVFRSWTAASIASGSVAVTNDATPPAFGSPALTITPSGSFTFASGTTVYYNKQASNSGSFTVAAPNVSDPETGVTKVNFPALGAMTGGGDDTSSPYQGSYSWTASSTASGSQTVTAYNGAGLTSSSGFTVTPDTAAPTGGSIAANGGSTYNNTGTVALSKVNFSDAGSGIAGNVLTRATGTLTNNVCGSLSGSTAVTITGGNDSSTLSNGCYQYTLTGTDNVANLATALSTIVKVDTTIPTGGAITANGAATFNTSGTVSLGVTNFTDAASGIATNAITRASALLSGNLCGSLSGASAVTVSLGNDSASLTSGCYQYTLTGTDNAGNQATALSTIVKVDRIVPAAAVSFPAGGGSYTAASWNAGASSSIAGSASDSETGLSAVSVSVRRTSTSLCWTGSTNVFTAACPNFVAVSGTTSWTKAFEAATSFPADGAYSATVRATDTAGNTFTPTATSFTYDNVAPTVSDVSSTLANGSYKAGQVVPVTVTFSEAVIVTGTPSLTLSTGSPATTTVNYSSGSGTSVLTFSYTVAAGNTSADLDYASTSALSLNGGTINDAAANPATLTLTAPAATHSLGANKNLVIDTTQPTISSVALTNGGPTAGKIEAGDTIAVTFSETMSVANFCSTWSGDGSNQTTSTSGNSPVTVTVADGTGTNDVLTVSARDCTFNFGSINLGSSAYVSGGNVIFSGNGSNASTIQWTASTRVLTITLSSKSGAGTAAAVTSSTPIYTASTSITDSAGNAVSNSPFTLPSGQKF